MEQLLINHIRLTFERQRGKFVLSVGEEPEVQQNVCEFLHTISFLVGKDIEKYLMSTDSCYDAIRIPLTSTGKTITLDLRSFIQFREVYSRQMFLLKLEDLLMHRGIQLSNLF